MGRKELKPPVVKPAATVAKPSSSSGKHPATKLKKLPRIKDAQLFDVAFGRRASAQGETNTSLAQRGAVIMYDHLRGRIEEMYPQSVVDARGPAIDRLISTKGLASPLEAYEILPFFGRGRSISSHFLANALRGVVAAYSRQVNPQTQLEEWLDAFFSERLEDLSLPVEGGQKDLKSKEGEESAELKTAQRELAALRRENQALTEAKSLSDQADKLRQQLASVKELLTVRKRAERRVSISPEVEVPKPAFKTSKRPNPVQRESSPSTGDDSSSVDDSSDDEVQVVESAASSAKRRRT